MLEEGIPEKAETLPELFVLSIKSSPDGFRKYKAPFVMERHQNQLKLLTMLSSQTPQPSSIRLMLAVALIHYFDVWTSDVKQAYLRSAELLSDFVFHRQLPLDFELNSGQDLQIVGTILLPV